jgi:hexosaminidase
MSDTIKSLSKTVIGWDEIIDANIDPDEAIIMWWRHDRQDQLQKSLEAKYKVVMCPRIPLYFDFVQDESHKYGRRWRGAFCDLETVYNFPPDTLAGIKEYSNQILGIQANLWTEVIHNNERLDFMTYPRISAMAEAAWTKGERSYDDFMVRLKPMLVFFKEKDIYYFDPFNPELNPEPAGPEVK